MGIKEKFLGFQLQKFGNPQTACFKLQEMDKPDLNPGRISPWQFRSRPSPSRLGIFVIFAARFCISLTEIEFHF